MALQKRCVMIVGDGFSRSFVNNLGLKEKIVTAQLFPPPKDVDIPWATLFEDYPEIVSDEEFTAQPVKYLFPLLWEAWETFNALHVTPELEHDTIAIERAFYDDMAATETINTDFNKGLLSFKLPSPAAQLRAYLFYIFRYYDELVKEHLTNEHLNSWQWTRPFILLNELLSMTYISFNYDCILEMALHSFGYQTQLPAFRGSFGVVTPARSRRVIKPHGSINYDFVLPSMIGGFSWRSNESRTLTFKENMLKGSFVEVTETPPKHPVMPDIVPPGHTLTDRLNPSFRLEQEIEYFLSTADLVILCGLSASEPDTVEIDSYLSQLRIGTPVFHIGLTNDRDNPAGQLLDTHSGYNRTFIDVLKEDLYELPYLIIGGIKAAQMNLNRSRPPGTS